MPFDPAVYSGYYQTLAQLPAAAARMSDSIDRYKQESSQAKAADAFVRANPDFLGYLGLTPEQFGNMSARDRHNTMIGGIQAHGFQQQQQQGALQRQVEQSRLDALQRAEEARKRRETSLASFWKSMSQLPPGESPTPETILRFAGQAGLDPRDMQDVGQFFYYMNRGQGKPPVEVPPGMVPKSAGPGGVTYGPDETKSEGNFVPVTGPDGKPIPGFWMDKTTRKVFQDRPDPLGGFTNPAPPASNTGKPAPPAEGGSGAATGANLMEAFKKWMKK